MSEKDRGALSWVKQARPRNSRSVHRNTAVASIAVALAVLLFTAAASADSAYSTASSVGDPTSGAAPATSASAAFTNPTPFTVPGTGPAGPAAPYSSAIPVTGLTGPITGVVVTLHRVGHTNPRDIDVVLVAPSGDGVWVMAGPCGEIDIEDFTWIFSQQGGAMPTDGPCDGFVYRPTNTGVTGSLAPPAPPGPYGTSFNDFNNKNPNGTWRLWVRDRFEGHSPSDPGVGDIEGGWSLAIETGPSDAVIPGTGTAGPANPYPITQTVFGQTGVITDLNVRIDGIFHPRPDDLDLLLVGPHGDSAVLMSDACGTFDVNAYGWQWDDEAAATMPDGDGTNLCGTTSHRPADHEPGEAWPAPAPIGPHGNVLTVFDLTDPNGEWRLFVNDDQSDETGFFTGRFQLQMTTRPRADVTFTESAVEIPEGETRTLTLARAAPGVPGSGSVTATSLPVTATSGSDFTPISSVIEFAPGETEKTIEVTALDDAEVENDETFVVSIGSATGDATVVAPTSVAVTIPATATPDPDPEPDTTAPETTVDKGPKKKTAKRKAKLKFTSNEAGSTFECKLDKRKWKACDSPKIYKKLKRGRHVFRVRATDPAANTDATPAKRKWKIVRSR